MTKNIEIIPVFLLLMFNLSAGAADGSRLSVTQEIDLDIWKVIVDTVATNDITRQGDAYSRDAILVGNTGPVTMTKELKKWGQDMIELQAKGNTATVSFRFSSRHDNAEVAFESGMFKYSEITKSGSVTSMYVPFEELILKKNGKWQVLMEHQFPDATQAEWDKLPLQ